MDLKFKGKRWLSQKPQKWLESVFNEIDGFISRDKAECAANQAATVGDSVKIDCPNVIQDSLPYYLEEPGKFEAQVGSSKHSDIVETYFSIGEKPVDTVVNKFSAELDPVDELNDTNEGFFDLASGHCIGEAYGDLPSGLEVHILKDSESNCMIDVEENDSKEEERTDKFSDSVVKENSTNEKPGKHEAQVESSENNGSFETCFQSVLNIGGKPVEIDVNRFSVELEGDHVNKSHEEFSHVPCGDYTGEADAFLSSDMEIEALKDNESNGVRDETITAKVDELVDRKTYIVVEENYMEEGLTHKYSDNFVEANDTEDILLCRKFDIVEDYCAEESSMKEEVDQCFSETKDLPEPSLLSESTQEKIETSLEVPPAGLLCNSGKGRLACSGESNMVNYVNDTLTMQSEGISVEDKAVDVDLTSSSTSLFTEIYNILKLPLMDDSHPEENICSSPRHALGYASEIGLLGVPVENKTVDMGLASSNAATLTTETSRVLELQHDDISNSEENICGKPVNADRCSFETLPQSSVCRSRKDKLASRSELNTVNGIPDTPALPSSETDLSGICVENKAVDMGLASSSTSLSTESCSNLELSRCQENICNNDVPAVRFASDLPYSVSSSHASQASSCDNNFADSTVSSSILSMLSNGGSFKVDIEDPDMETIELFESIEKAKLDGNCVVDSELLHAASFRALRHRSYKKILKDAFASRKRLRKEYEQLAILYGDIDIETNPQPATDLLSLAASSSSVHSEKSFPGSSETEWELL